MSKPRVSFNSRPLEEKIFVEERPHQVKMAVPESGQSPDPPPVGAQAPQEPDAFYAQEYFTSQGEIRFTE